MANWQQDDFAFDFNSVMLSSFYDNNFKTVDQLVQNYNPQEYSVVRNSDNTRNVYDLEYQSYQMNHEIKSKQTIVFDI